MAVFLCDEDMPGYAEVLEQMYRDKELSLIPVFATKPIKMRVLRVQIQNALEYRWIFFIIWCILLVLGGGVYMPSRQAQKGAASNWDFNGEEANEKTYNFRFTYSGFTDIDSLCGKQSLYRRSGQHSEGIHG